MNDRTNSMPAKDSYHEIVKRLIYEYAKIRPSHGNIDTEVIIDMEKGHYEVLRIGWDGVRRVHGSIIHIDIIDDKIWIQYDGTSRPIADELLAAGIPKESIVLAFYPADERGYTEFATG